MFVIDSAIVANSNVNSAASPKPAVTEAPTKAQASTEATIYYANCTAVREAGAAPLYKGDPGYSQKLDRDGDGIACSS
ncbi:excalibur calcium-binding domain-containing protein [Paenibacillus luteus]|uniref:excalibur calcium-binding domain-containing protein n=1 Tax=Paenibacillus luteus TaxID=2545753 RepID=UPI003BABC89F